MRLLFYLVTIFNFNLVKPTFLTYVTYVNTTVNPSMGNVTFLVHYKNKNLESYSLDVDLFTYKEISKFFVDFKFYRVENDQMVPIIKYVLDVCELYRKGTFREKLFVYFNKLFKNYGHVATRCPVKPVSMKALLDIF